MFDWVVVDVIHMPAPIVFVPDQVLPEAFLPHLSGLALVGGGEAFLDRFEAVGEIVVSIGQAPDAVQVIGHENKAEGSSPRLFLSQGLHH